MSSSLKKYKRVKYLGKGSYGAAILVELRANPSQKFVVKEIVIGHLKESEQAAAKKEADVLHQMTHSNITMYIESFVENSKLYIVMEYADGGDLSASVQRRKSSGQKWPEDEVMRIFVQICLALKHIHERNILHRDLKSQNIFLTNKGIVKLGDFGIAKVLDASEDQARTQIGTPYYLSPEICDSRPYGRQSDIWSLGVVLFELLALELPFQASSLPGLIHKIMTIEPTWKLIQSYSDPTMELAKAMLHKIPDSRPTIKDTVKSELIKSHISKLLSHTLKVGRGGAEGAIASERSVPSAAVAAVADNSKVLSQQQPQALAVIDAEEADRNIEIERAKERQLYHEKNNSVAQAHAEKQRQLEEEREKLRKYRQEVLRKKAQGEGGMEEVAVVLPNVPRPSVPSGQPSQQQHQIMSRNNSNNNVNNYPHNNNRRADAVSMSVDDQYHDHYRRNSYNDIDESLRETLRSGDRDRDRGREGVGIGIGGSPDSYARGGAAAGRDRGGGLREKSLSEIREERAAAAAALRGAAIDHYSNNNHDNGREEDYYRHRGQSDDNQFQRPTPNPNHNPYSRDQSSNSRHSNYNYNHNANRAAPPPLVAGGGAVIAGGAVLVRAAPPFNRGGNVEIGYSGAGIESRRNNNINNNNPQMDEFAKREFMANREAAQQFKARVEADMRGGGAAAAIGSDVGGGGGGGGYGEGRAARASFDGMNGGGGLDRIAQVKAQRDRERERELAEKDRLLAIAYEEQKEERKKFDERRMLLKNQEKDVSDNGRPLSGVAIGGGGGGGVGDLHDGYEYEYERERDRDRGAVQRRRRREEEEAKQTEALALAAKQAREDAKLYRERAEKVAGAGAVAFQIDFKDDVPTPVAEAKAGRRRRGAGGKEEGAVPVAVPEPREVDVGRAPPAPAPRDMTELQSLLPKQPRRQWGPPPSVDDFKISPGRVGIHGRRPRNTPPPSLISPREEESPRSSVTEWAEPSNPEEVIEGEKSVLQKLEERDNRQEADRAQAKQIFRKLREQKRKESEAKALISKPPSAQGGRRGVNINRKEPKLSVEEVLLKVNQAAEEVGKIVGNLQLGNIKNNNSSNNNKKVETTTADGSSHNDSSLFDLSDSESELEKTLDKWLLKKKDNPNISKEKYTPCSEPLRQSEADFRPGASEAGDTDSEMNDNEVVGFQCLLAEALMTTEGEQDDDG